MSVRGRTGGGSKGLFAAALLATTILAGGGFAWAESGATGTATAPLGLAPVVNQAGFGDLAAKVRPAVVNIATTGDVEQAADEQGSGTQQKMPNFPQGRRSAKCSAISARVTDR